MRLQTCVFLASLIAASSPLADSLRIVTEEWPPFIYAEAGVIKGADKDISEHLLKQMGYEVEWKLKPWRRVLRDVAKGEADAILDIAPHPDYTANYLFTAEPLSTHETVLFHDRRRPHAFQSLTDLSGLVIGVSPGYLYNNDAFISSDAFYREPAPSFEANLQKLVRGRVDMVAMSRPVGLYTSHALGLTEQVAYHPEPLSQSDFYLAFHQAPQWQEPAQTFSVALKAFKKTEEYQRILHRYRLENQDGKLTLMP
ncbi:transporter substrate-binding domain-containing protein [uncultured Halopseudomonas sp.]|uniref:substrate-binding periplasmic protein n=1 Tax=uncultured Halopseudomonas sp. TaxID=2901193 RepID=UPI0030EDB5C0|tara:strand:+ start:7336 stop:8100 length:765 start_codon:yes stop_codon:yes gene_type:complete